MRKILLTTAVLTVLALPAHGQEVNIMNSACQSEATLLELKGASITPVKIHEVDSATRRMSAIDGNGLVREIFPTNITAYAKVLAQIAKGSWMINHNNQTRIISVSMDGKCVTVASDTYMGPKGSKRPERIPEIPPPPVYDEETTTFPCAKEIAGIPGGVGWHTASVIGVNPQKMEITLKYPDSSENTGRNPPWVFSFPKGAFQDFLDGVYTTAQSAIVVHLRHKGRFVAVLMGEDGGKFCKVLVARNEEKPFHPIF